MRVAVLVLAALLGLVPALAHAECPTPTVRFSPESGALPAQPTIYAWVPHGEADGTFTATTRLDVTRVESGGAFDVFHIRVDQDRGPVTVRYIPRRDYALPMLRDATFTVGAEPIEHVANVREIEHAEKHGCPAFNGATIGLDGDAVALRLDWHHSDGSTFVPAPAAFVGASACEGWTGGANIADREADLVALFSDGSEQVVHRDAWLPLDRPSADSRWPYPVGALLAAMLLASAALVLRGQHPRITWA